MKVDDVMTTQTPVKKKGGRPKGALNKTKMMAVNLAAKRIDKIIPVSDGKEKLPVVDLNTKRIMADRLIKKVVEMRVTPVEVMMLAMKIHYDQAKEALGFMEVNTDEDVRARLFGKAKMELADASHYAEKVAPYLHPKLQTVTVNEKTNHVPALTSANLKSLDESEITVMEVLMAKIAADHKPEDKDGS